MAGFDPREIMRTIVSVCNDLSTALDMMLNVQEELLGVDFEADEWGDWEWERITGALGWVESAEEQLKYATEDLARLKQQLEELKREYERRALAGRG